LIDGNLLISDVAIGCTAQKHRKTKLNKRIGYGERWRW
jgi:hypothetical protein